MLSTTPSHLNTATSSPTTSNREYVLLDTKDQHDRYWYGYYEGSTCYWSDWHDSILDCLEAKLQPTGTYKTADEFLDAVAYTWKFVYRSTEPLHPLTHPEYFI